MFTKWKFAKKILFFFWFFFFFFSLSFASTQIPMVIIHLSYVLLYRLVMFSLGNNIHRFGISNVTYTHTIKSKLYQFWIRIEFFYDGFFLWFSPFLFLLVYLCLFLFVCYFFHLIVLRSRMICSRHFSMSTECIESINWLPRHSWRTESFTHNIETKSVNDKRTDRQTSAIQMKFVCIEFSSFCFLFLSGFVCVIVVAIVIVVVLYLQRIEKIS